MAVNLNEICRLCLEEIKIPSATLKEGCNLLIKIRRFLPLVKVSFIKISNIFFGGGGGCGGGWWAGGIIMYIVLCFIQ
jgi:hypothetical protein